MSATRNEYENFPNPQTCAESLQEFEDGNYVLLDELIAELKEKENDRKTIQSRASQST